MGSTLSIVIELIVALLLVVTISYCFIVNRKLTALRTDQTGLRQVVSELNRSTERAEKAIVEMRRTAQQVDGEMSSHLDAARQTGVDLEDKIERLRDVKELAEKLSTMDLDQFRNLARGGSQRPVETKQMKLAKELKRQRLGFSRDKFQSATTVNDGKLSQGVGG